MLVSPCYCLVHDVTLLRVRVTSVTAETQQHVVFFQHYLKKKRHDFGKKVIEYKVCFGFL